MPTIDRVLPLFPLERVVLFPGMLLPLHIFEERYKVMIGSCQVTDGVFGVLLIRSGREVGAPAKPVYTGCTARIREIERLPDGRMNLIAQGEHRFRLQQDPETTPEGYLQALASITTVEEPGLSDPSGLVARVVSRYRTYLHALAEMTNRDARAAIQSIPEAPLDLSFAVAAGLRVHPRERQALLETDDLALRLEAERVILERENTTLRLMRGAKGGEKSVGPFSLN
jgi:Lon protease-like protein